MEVRGLKTLHAFANVLGIIPTYKNCDQSLQKAPTHLDKVKAIVLIVVFIFAIGYNLWGKLFDYGQYVENTILLVNTLAEILVALINIICVYKLNLKDGKKLLRFLHKLQSLESFVVNKDDVDAANRRALIKFYLLHFLGVIFGCCSAYVYVTTFGFNVYKYFMLREFQNTHFMILMHMIICYAELIGLRMAELNVHLKRLCFKQQNAETLEGKERIVSVELISEAYIKLAELVDEGNGLFGILILLFCGNMIVNIMVPVNMTLLYLKKIPLYSTTAVGIEFIGFCLFWVIFPILIGGKLLCVCNRVENEAHIVPRLCYTLMKRLGNHESKLRTDLDNYGSQADRVKIKFSAGGLFDVNLGLMMPIIGSIFTYLIVLMQFHKL